MNAFLDTSALIKLYHTEVGSDHLAAYIEEYTETVFLSELAKLEFRSAMWRRVRMHEIERDAALRVIAYFEIDYDNYVWIDIQSDLVQTASALFKTYGEQGLRTLDALQLASALKVKSAECMFFTSDNLLKSFFLKEGLSMIEL